MSADGHFFMMDDDAFFYVNLGTNAAPSWTLVDFAEEVSADLSEGDIDLMFNGSDFKLSRGGKFDLPLSFKYSRAKADASDPIHDRIFDSKVKREPIQFAWTDLPITDANAKGFKCYFRISKYPFKKAAEGQQMLDIEARPTDYCEAGTLVLPELIGATP